MEKLSNCTQSRVAAVPLFDPHLRRMGSGNKQPVDADNAFERGSSC